MFIYHNFFSVVATQAHYHIIHHCNHLNQSLSTQPIQLHIQLIPLYLFKIGLFKCLLFTTAKLIAFLLVLTAIFTFISFITIQVLMQFLFALIVVTPFLVLTFTYLFKFILHLQPQLSSYLNPITFIFQSIKVYLFLLRLLTFLVNFIMLIVISILIVAK